MQKSKSNDLINTTLTQIPQLPLHPKYNVFLYSRHLLSKISWHLTEADLSKTWFSEILILSLHSMFNNGWKFQCMEHSAMSPLLQQNLV